MVLGQGLEAASAGKAVAESYAREEFDEFVKPTVIVDNGKPIATIGASDSIIFFNFWITYKLADIAHKCCSGRIVSLLEGGYNLTALAHSTGVHVAALMEAGR
jgi:hypothetical protein